MRTLNDDSNYFFIGEMKSKVKVIKALSLFIVIPVDGRQINNKSRCLLQKFKFNSIRKNRVQLSKVIPSLLIDTELVEFEEGSEICLQLSVSAFNYI